MSPSSRSKLEPALPSDPAAELEALSEVVRAIDHPSRRRILLVLRFRGGSMTAGQIAERFSCSWPSTTRHLKVLREAGLIRLERRGRERCYHLETARLDPLRRWLGWFEGEEPSETEAARGSPS